MDKIKKSFSKLLDFVKKDKVSFLAAPMIIVVVFAYNLIVMNKTINSSIIEDFAKMFKVDMSFMQNVLMQALLSFITALIVWGIFEGISRSFYKMYTQRSMLTTTKNQFLGVVRTAFFFASLLIFLITLLAFIPNTGALIIGQGLSFFKMISYTLVLTFAYMLMEDSVIIRANIATAYYPLQRLYKIYYGLQLAFDIFNMIQLVREKTYSSYSMVILALTIVLYIGYFSFVNLVFLKKYMARQNAAVEARNKMFSGDQGIEDILHSMGIDLGDTYKMYNPQDNQASQMPKDDEYVITVVPEELDEEHNDDNKEDK